ncbi:MAG: phosphatidylglycerophosphatase A [candidate division Zixibacteria bacterium]
MTDDKFAGKGFFTRLLATFFFAGYLPKAPGTWGSAFTLLILFFAWPEQWYYQIVAIAAVYIIGVWVSGKAEEYFGHDGSPIVIDEVAGQMTALFMAPVKFLPFVLGFVLFRIFDIFKPPPANLWQSYRKGWGVMADDMAAGFYAACILQLLLFFLDRWGINYI